MPSRSHLPRSSPLTFSRGLTSVLGVFLGGLVGSGVREAIGRLFSVTGDGLPVDLLVVNLVGSLLLGWYLARRERAWTGLRWSFPFWAVGVMGSFTTFSGFSHDVLQLVNGGRAHVAVTYVLVSIVGGLVCAQTGQRLGRSS